MKTYNPKQYANNVPLWQADREARQFKKASKQQRQQRQVKRNTNWEL